MKTLVAVLLVAAGASCATGLKSEYVLTGAQRPPYTGPVRVVLDGTPFEGTFTEVAIVSATGGGGDATLPAVVGQLQSQAAKLGCNAVIRIRYDHGSNNASATGVAVWLDAPSTK
jgi:hypothetical protein